MWIKVEDKTYQHAESGASMLAQTMGGGGARIQLVRPNSSNVTVRSGFADVVAAQAVLDDFMSEQGFEELTVPESDVEGDE